VVASNGARSFVLSADPPIPAGAPVPLPADACHAPVVRFADDLTRSYAAVRIPSDTSDSQWPFYVLVVDHPVSRVPRLGASAPSAPQSVVAVRFAAAASSVGTGAARVVAVTDTYQPTGRIGNTVTFASATDLDRAVLFDPASGALIGVARSSGPYVRTDAPPITAYQLADAVTVSALLKQVGEPVTPGDAASSPRDLTAARLRAAVDHLAFPVFARVPGQPKPQYTGLAFVVGATSASTVFVSLLPTGPKADLYVAVRQRDEAVRMVPVTVVVPESQSQLAFLQGPKLDVAVPRFRDPAGGAAVVVPELFGASCGWTPPAPAPDQCPLRLNAAQLQLPPEYANAPQWLIAAGKPKDYGLSAVSMWSGGAPVIDASSGSVVAIVWVDRALSLATVAHALDEAHAGIVLDRGH
jgi:hypothetical protein